MSVVAVPAAVDLQDTPVAIIDLDVMEANIRRLQTYCDVHGLANRPHIKTHKIPALARQQVSAGAVGITCQKLGEVAVMLEAGLTDILLTYTILGEAKLTRLRALADRPGVRLTVACDSAPAALALSSAFRTATRPLPVIVECDTGAGRMGTQTPAETVELAQLIARLPGLQFEGVMTYPITEETGRFFEATLERLERIGLRPRVVSTGGTPVYLRAHQVPGVTEHRAGTYIFNDRATVASGAATWEDCAMRVRTTVISRPTPTRAILDAGSKSLSSDLMGQSGYGLIVEYPDAVIARLNEEHGIVDLSRCAKKPEVGEIVSVIPNHACVVTNLHDFLVGVRGERVEVVWPVAARGMIR
jgi:D-serine deaminase-like pyridoxal phosphate-dependent protein